jgi:hypothetical protein
VNARARLAVLIIGSAVGAYLGILAHRRATQPAATEAPQAAEPPVPAPAGLVAEAILPSPDATWRKAQVTVGGVVLLAPETFGGILGSASRVSALSKVIDGASPAYAVMGEGGRWVVAAHVVTASRARSTLLGNDGGASGIASDGRAGNLEVLRGDGAWLGLAGEYVLVGSDRDAITSLGPYAYRTLPTRPLPPNGVWASAEHAALAGFVKRELDERREGLEKFLLAKDQEQRAAHGGREPDLADPKPLVAALDAFATEYEDRIVGMQRAELALDVDDDGMHARVTFTPPQTGDARGWVDELEGGPTAALSASSADTLATLFWRSQPQDRERAATSATETITSALGTRLPATDEAKIGENLGRIAKARAGWAMLSVTSGASPGAILRLATNDPATVTSAVEGTIDLARKPAWAKWEADALGLKKIDRAPGRATFVMEQGAFQASWATRGNEFDLAAGLDASSVLAAANPSAQLGSDPKVAGWLRGLHGDVVWALVAHPLLVATSPRSDAALVALVHGQRAVALDARATGVLVRQLVVSSSKGF